MRDSVMLLIIFLYVLYQNRFVSAEIFFTSLKGYAVIYAVLIAFAILYILLAIFEKLKQINRSIYMTSRRSLGSFVGTKQCQQSQEAEKREHRDR